MEGIKYFEDLTSILNKVRTTQEENIQKAAGLMASAIKDDKLVYLFGSGHSNIPVLDIFPRYGGFVGFRPLLDPRLMWFNVVGPGGARELLWLERQDGYISNFLQSYVLLPGEVMVVFSHGGLNSAPIEAALYAKERGLSVVAITCKANYEQARATHPTGKKLGDLADVLIDTCVPPEDALIQIPGLEEKTAGASTVVAAAIGASLVAETAAHLVRLNFKPKVFVSPNVTGVSPSHNQEVFRAYESLIRRHDSQPHFSPVSR